LILFSRIGFSYFIVGENAMHRVPTIKPQIKAIVNHAFILSLFSGGKLFQDLIIKKERKKEKIIVTI
jgi:hypothetical protein